MEAALSELKDRLGKLTDLRRTEAVLVWDMTVFMPPGGAPTRAAQLATMQEITHALRDGRPLRRALRRARAVRGLASRRLRRRLR